MGILNVTPDSFSDGAPKGAVTEFLRKAEAMVVQGADIIDIGGESTRPGASSVPLDTELARILPVLREIVSWNVPVSIDTYKAGVMSASLECGADMINDVSALEDVGALNVIAQSNCAVCLMHKKGQPDTMQQAPHYQDVMSEIRNYLDGRLAAARRAGVARERLVIDPGFGFGKTFEDNIELMRRLPEFKDLGSPVLVGMSRKAMLGKITGRPVSERMVASIAAALVAIRNGAGIVRVHDVAATKDALSVWAALT
ncbi:dihydropteroate synthase [Parachitinimonas caeni]|uniref:dihydropteroate synthase n=1 Tax=Parachitinimonas caeni TaxID=3031301 RepID=A0ABT7DXI8_9NEIS|nr:dihydropteroate synthase [Parachitinimonas caeni]MDK2124791.1 dihydropteroate synthase [Parachitinimonas caeni]